MISTGKKILRRMLAPVRLTTRVMECCRLRNHAATKTVFRVLSEVYQYQKYWRDDSSVEDYFFYELDRRHLSVDDMLAYIPGHAHGRLQRVSRYPEYECTASDKRYMYLMFKAMNIPHPEVVLLFFHGIVTDACFRRLDLATAARLVMDSPVQRYFLKPAFSGRSVGMDVISIVKGQLRRMDGSMTDLEGIVKEASELPAGYVMQCEMRDQHPVMSELNPDSVNTLRIVTYRSGRSYEILRIVLRIGRKGSRFDNIAAGGVFVNVDPDSFETSGECFVYQPSIASFGEFHPDTKVRLSGIKIPYSDEIRAMLEEVTIVYSEHSYLGWDVAVTRRGPCLIEVNAGPDIDSHQIVAGRGLRDDFYYHPNKTHKQKTKWMEEWTYRRSVEDRQHSNPKRA